MPNTGGIHCAPGNVRRRVAQHPREHVAPDERGNGQRERDPELVAEHRDAVARVLVVAAVPFVRIATALIHVTCLAGHFTMLGVANFNGPLGHGTVIMMGMARRRVPIRAVSSGRSLTVIAHLAVSSRGSAPPWRT